MTRAALNAAHRTEATGPVVRAVELLDIAFPSGTIYVASGDRTYQVDGKTYKPGRMIGPPKGMAETADLSPRRVTIQLSGVDAELLKKVVEDDFHFAKANVWLGLLNENWQLVSSPIPFGKLFLSEAPVVLDAGSSTIEISAESRSIMYLRNRAAMATPESQRRRHVGDTGLDNVRAISEQILEWGGVRQSVGDVGDRVRELERIGRIP